MSKAFFKDKINGNELDLSLNDLTEVPVKELAAYPKATHLDLSCNHIQILPNAFTSLNHLVKIDLSKNQLPELPHNFGNLHNLQYLDLYGNELTFLPVSFCRLKSLRWLDLKNNPLDPKLKAVAGDCLDEKQCQACAKKVVAFMQAVDSDLEREKQRKLKEEREREATRKAQEERELEKLRKQKKAEREKRKAEKKTKKEVSPKQKHEERKPQEPSNVKQNGCLKRPEKQKNSGSCWTFVFLLLMLPILFLSILLGFHIYSGHNIQSFDDLRPAIEESWLQLQNLIIVWWKAFVIPYSLSVQDSLTKLLHSCSLFNVSNVL